MICENCCKEHSGDFGSGRFCSKRCAKSFSTKNINRKETKKCKMYKLWQRNYNSKICFIKKL